MHTNGHSTPSLRRVPGAVAMGLWLAVVSLLAFFHGLFTLAPLDKTEALQIGIAETMQRLHHWDVYLPVMLGLLWPTLRRLWQQRRGWSEVACGSQRLQQLAGLWLVVVAEAQLPTVFGSPLQPASPRPVSSYENWKRHTNDAEALVLGRCRSVQSLEREQAGQLTILEQHGRYCLGRLVRGASKP